MEYTAPQRFLLEDKNLDDYKMDIAHRPGALEFILDKAKAAGLSTVDLKDLLGFAQKEGYIDMGTYKFHARRLDLAQTRKMRRTGEFKNPDEEAIIKTDEDDPSKVRCTVCAETVPFDQAHQASLGWRCDRCYGKRPTKPRTRPVGGDETITRQRW